MRRAHKLLLQALICTALIAAPAVDAATSKPTPKQIQAAVSTATHSQFVWATVNSCGFHGNHELGIRGQMPALPFPAHLLMVVTVRQWSATAHRYVPLTRTYKLGGTAFEGTSLVQNGISLTFASTATLIASIDFEWFRGGKLLGSTTRMTTAGHGVKNADAGTPSGYSAAACSIS